MDQRDELLGRVEQIAPILAAHSQMGDEVGRLPDASLEALASQDMFGILAPRALGGQEASPSTAFDLWEAIARSNSASAWNLAQSNAGMIMAARLPSPADAQIFRDGATPRFAIGNYPPARGNKVAAGYRLSGRVATVSGCRYADWLVIPFLTIVDGVPELDPATRQPLGRMAFIPQASVRVIDSWHVMGMRGTGSDDIEFENVFAGDELIITPGTPGFPRSPFDGPLYQLSHWPIVQGEASVSLGIAAAAIALMKGAADRIPAMAAAPLRERVSVQSNIARATALLDSARTYLHHTATSAYDAVAASGDLTLDHKLAMQLASCLAAEHSAKAVDLVFDSVGTAAVRRDARIERHFRDVHVLTQHSTKSSERYTSVGRMMMGLPADHPLLR